MKNVFAIALSNFEFSKAVLITKNVHPKYETVQNHLNYV